MLIFYFSEEVKMINHHLLLSTKTFLSVAVNMFIVRFPHLLLTMIHHFLFSTCYLCYSKFVTRKMLITHTNIPRCTFVVVDYKTTYAETINLLFLQSIEILRIKQIFNDISYHILI